jgi:hypothetical protein
MKEIRIALENTEYEKLIKMKGDLTWKQYFCKELK